MKKVKSSQTLSNLIFISQDQKFANELALQAQEFGFNVLVTNDLSQLPEQENQCVVALYDYYHREDLLKIQRQVKNMRIPFLSVELEFDSVSVGPYVPIQGNGCAKCHIIWSRSEWSNYHLSVTSDHTSIPSSCYLNLPVIIELVAQSLSSKTPKQVNIYKFTSSECHVRNFISHPNCSDCHSKQDDKEELAAYQWKQRLKLDPLQFRQGNQIDANKLISTFYGNRSGLVRHLFDDPNSSLMPMSVASFIHDGAVSIFENGYGRTNSKSHSKTVALLEAIERFCGYMTTRKKTNIRASYNQVKDRAINPRDFILHDSSQYQEPGFDMKAYDDTLEYNWVYAYSFKKGGPVLIPEQFVYYRLPDPKQQPSNRFVYEVSNGCAMGDSLEEATLHGLFEVIERDAFLCNWYRRETPIELCLNYAKRSDIQNLVARSQAQGYQVHVFDISAGIGVCSIWAMIVNPAKNAPVKAYCAGGASIDPEQAIYSALVEVCTSITVYENQLPEKRHIAEAMIEQPNLVQTMEDHVLLYSHDGTFSRFSYLFSNQPPTPLQQRFKHWYNSKGNKNLTDDLMSVVDGALKLASDVIVVDQSFDEMRNENIHCVKVLAPGLLPVSFGHQYRRISLERLNAGLPIGQEKYDWQSINQHPHNFP